MVTAETLERITVIARDTTLWSTERNIPAIYHKARELSGLLARNPLPVDDIYDNLFETYSGLQRLGKTDGIYDIIDSYLWALRRVNTELLYPRDR